FARSHRRAQGARPHRGGGIAAHLGQFDSGDARRPRRRRRQPHPRRPRRGVLEHVRSYSKQLAPHTRCIPSPACGGGIGTGHATRSIRPAQRLMHTVTPSPTLPRLRGRGHTASAARTTGSYSATHFSEALLATSAHLVISLLRKAASFSGEPPT